MSDLVALQGRWKVVTLEVAGNKIPGSMFPDAIVSVSGDMFESSGMGAVYRGKMALSQSGAGKTFSLNFRDGPEAGNVNNALYELDGDTWTICLDMKGGPAPTSLASTAANGYALEMLRRV